MAIVEDPSDHHRTTRFWHPFADMGAVSRSELVIERGEGVHVFDAEGRRYLDGTASLWYTNLGYGRARGARGGRRADGPDRGLLDVRRLRQPRRPTRSPRGSPSTRRWTTREVFLASGGGDAIDTAAKIARRHWALRGQPERVHLISRTNGYHGTHGFGTSIGGIEANVANWGPLIPHTSAVAHDSLPALEAGDPARRARARGRVLLRAGDRRGRRASARGGLHRGRRRPVRRARDPARRSTP